MTDFIAYLASGKGTWGHVNRIIQDQEWENIFLVTNNFGKENFHPEKPVNFILIDTNKGIKEMRDEIKKELDGKLKNDVAINFVSGIGKEHMALLGALLQLGVGIRLVALTKDGIEEV